jgi:hypothetical protein
VIDVLMLFRESADPEAVDELLRRLVPSMKAGPGLRSMRLSSGPLMSPRERPPFVRVLEASYDSLADWMAQVPTEERRDERDVFDRVAPLVLFFEAADA